MSRTRRHVSGTREQESAPFYMCTRSANTLRSVRCELGTRSKSPLKRTQRSFHSLQQSTTQTAKVGVLWVVNLDHAPRIDSSSNELAVHFKLLLGADDGERKERLRIPSFRMQDACKEGDILHTRSSLFSMMVSSSSSSTSYGKL